jgi:hypothetical protein
MRLMFHMIHEHSMIEEWDEEMVKLVEKKEDNDTLKLPMSKHCKIIV